MEKYISALLTLMLISISAQAAIKGKIIDTIGEPIISATVYWENSSKGTVTDIDGNFELERIDNTATLVVKYTGYDNYKVDVADSQDEIVIELGESVRLSDLTVVERRAGTGKLTSSVMNIDVISGAELCRAACCNLGESFTTNPSVDVNYTDAATGAKQIQLLGLSNSYVQMLTENIPNFRGAAAPYGLGYVPGTWMESIQVSKGISSVKNGYEAMTGQINVEFKKPNTADKFSANIFASTEQRYEINADFATPINNNLSTMFFVHGETETAEHDSNDDNFMDMPKVQQLHLFNRWQYDSGAYHLQAGVKGLIESRKSGQTANITADKYEIGIDTKRVEAFLKNAYILDVEHNSNFALILSGSIHNQDSYFGNKIYNVNQLNGYASLMYETEFNANHSLSTGLSLNYDSYNQDYRLVNNPELELTKQLVSETVSGAYAQYTYNLDSKLIFMAGLRGDYSSEYGFFITPRAHIKYLPSELIHIRLSAGKGYRSSNHILAENNYLMASGREIIIDSNLEQEDAWNFGTSITSYVSLFGRNLTINLEYFYTNFLQQTVIDRDSNSSQVIFSNLDGRSYSSVYQVELSYPIIQGLTLTTTFRGTDAKCTYNGELMEKPLTSHFKGLITTSYQTPLELWQFDVTLQYNGGGRMPTAYTLEDGTQSWDSEYGAFEQLNAQITRYFRNWSVYIGGENLTNFTQSNPIISADDPWSDTFDSTMIWGPVHGIKVYIGARFNI